MVLTGYVHVEYVSDWLLLAPLSHLRSERAGVVPWSGKHTESSTSAFVRVILQIYHMKGRLNLRFNYIGILALSVGTLQPFVPLESKDNRLQQTQLDVSSLTAKFIGYVLRFFFRNVELAEMSMGLSPRSLESWMWLSPGLSELSDLFPVQLSQTMRHVLAHSLPDRPNHSKHYT